MIAQLAESEPFDRLASSSIGVRCAGSLARNSGVVVDSRTEPDSLAELGETELVGDAPAPAVQRELLADRVNRWYDASRSYWLDHQPRPTP